MGFGVPACAFAAVAQCISRRGDWPYSLTTSFHLCSYILLSFGYFTVGVTCALADFVYIRCGHRSFYGRVDIVVAAVVFFASNVDFVLRATIAETVIMSSTAMIFFFYSGCSRSAQQWVFRHSLWHAV